jgi:hypothetical protein
MQLRRRRLSTMASSYRPNRYLAPSLRGQRAIEAEEIRMREQIRRENAIAAARKAAAQPIEISSAGSEQSSRPGSLKK